MCLIISVKFHKFSVHENLMQARCQVSMTISTQERQLNEVKHMKNVHKKVKPIEWLSKNKEKVQYKGNICK